MPGLRRVVVLVGGAPTGRACAICAGTRRGPDAAPCVYCFGTGEAHERLTPSALELASRLVADALRVQVDAGGAS